MEWLEGTKTMTDEDLLGYFEIHSRTERALVHRDMVVRLLELAGREVPSDLIEWIAVHHDVADPLVAEARKMMSARAHVTAAAEREGKTLTPDEHDLASRLACDLAREAEGS
jgi:hypothetical protein